MALVKLIEYAEASAEVKTVYDDIMKTRGIDWINNFWSYETRGLRVTERYSARQ